jgi:hypothetical protein
MKLCAGPNLVFLTPKMGFKGKRTAAANHPRPKKVSKSHSRGLQNERNLDNFNGQDLRPSSKEKSTYSDDFIRSSVDHLEKLQDKT